MIVRSLLAVAALAMMASAASADPITYSTSFVASGTLDGNAFTSLVFTGSADTNSVTGPDSNGNYSVIAPVYVTATLVSGGTLTDEIYGSLTKDAGFFVSQMGQSNVNGGLPQAGFFDNYAAVNGDPNSTAVVIAAGSQAFSTYDLKSVIQVTGPAFIDSQNYSEKTYEANGSSGALIITSNPDAITFTAAVPEPSSLAMTAIALLIGCGVQWRRKRDAKTGQALSIE